VAQEGNSSREQLAIDLDGNSYIPQAVPFVKWAGGKTQLLDTLARYVPKEFERYYEPFVGGGALFFHLQPSMATLGDANAELINCYRCVRDCCEPLIELLSKYPYDEDFYYSMRASCPTDSLERAARFLYLNRTCFNGLYRVNKQGQFNVPMGRYRNPLICEADKLRACSLALQGVELLQGDYEATVSGAQRGDFVYIDPPYHPISRYSDFKRYTRDFFYEEDQVHLRDVIVELVDRGCYVLASNSYCDFILDLYSDFTIVPVMARRSINKDGSKRSSIREALIVGYSI